VSPLGEVGPYLTAEVVKSTTARPDIPIRNLWFLLMYAAGLAEFIGGRFDIAPDDAADIADLLARLLAFVVERRLRRSLSRAYLPRSAVLTRVRGRIDVLRTESKQHRKLGRIVCRFDEFTMDTPRNRLARAALETVSGDVEVSETAHRCRTLARDLARLGVSSERPSRSEMRRDQIARHDAEDRLMVSVAQLALDRVLPSEGDGESRVTGLNRDRALLSRIFERAVAGFYKHELDGRNGWQVAAQRHLLWDLVDATEGLRTLLPNMRADIILDNPSLERRLVIDTKFANILTPREHGGTGLDSSHIYQLYAYLRSQSGYGMTLADKAEGMLLYPTIDRCIDEAVTIQGHRIRFATVDLLLKPQGIRNRLLSLIREPI
jgi:5-methylcytosine-specific restriction enzyme subunit McrC